MRGRGVRHHQNKTITVEKEVREMAINTIVDGGDWELYETKGDRPRAFIRAGRFAPKAVPPIPEGADVLKACRCGSFGVVWWRETDQTARLIDLEARRSVNYVWAVDGVAQLGRLDGLVEEHGAEYVFGDAGGMEPLEGLALTRQAGAGLCRAFLVVDKVADRPDLYAAEFLKDYRSFESGGATRVVVVAVDLETGGVEWRQSATWWRGQCREMTNFVVDELSNQVLQYLCDRRGSNTIEIGEER